MRFLRIVGMTLMILGALALLALGVAWLLPQVSWGFAAEWLTALRAAVEAPVESVPLQWLQTAGRHLLDQSLYALYLSGGVLLLGVSLWLLGRQRSQDADAPAPERPARRSEEELAFMPRLQYSAPVYEDEPEAFVPPAISATRQEPPAALPARAATPKPRTEPMVTCPVCHTLNNAKAYYCHHCKSDLPERFVVEPRAALQPVDKPDVDIREIPAPVPVFTPSSRTEPPARDEDAPTDSPAPIPPSPPTPVAPTTTNEARKPLRAAALTADAPFPPNEALTPVRLSARIISTVGVKR